MAWRVPPMWKDGRCWIIGGGPSVPRQFEVPENIIQKVLVHELPPSSYSDYMSPIHREHVIGVNNVYKIGTWIDVLFFGDCSWYLLHRRNLAKWPGLKTTCCNRFKKKKSEESEGIKYLQKDHDHRKGISLNQTKVSWNNNSGAAAISLAAHLGVRQILLLGFDMSLDKNKVSHWHGSHGKPYEKKRNPPFQRHLIGFPAIAKDAKTRGIEILNLSPKSAIKDLKKANLSDIL